MIISQGNHNIVTTVIHVFDSWGMPLTEVWVGGRNNCIDICDATANLSLLQQLKCVHLCQRFLLRELSPCLFEKQQFFTKKTVVLLVKTKICYACLFVSV